MFIIWGDRLMTKGVAIYLTQCVPIFSEEPKRKRKPPSKVKSATNSHGMTVTPTTDSQLAKTYNMKQSNIIDIFNKGVSISSS